MSNVVESTFKLMRALRRKAPMGERHVPPTVGKLLVYLEANDGAISSQLCEFLDIRPSSLSELLTKMEGHELIEKKTSDEDKRMTQIFLSEKGKEKAKQIAENRSRTEAEFSECFSEEEKEQFCALAEKLAQHLETSSADGKKKITLFSS